MALITVDGLAFPGINKYKVTRSDLDSDNTTRSESGYLNRERIRQGVYQVEFSAKVTKTQMKSITDKLNDARFSATIFDPTTSTSTTITMYAGNRSGDLVKLVDGDEANSLWDFSCTLVQY